MTWFSWTAFSYLLQVISANCSSVLFFRLYHIWEHSPMKHVSLCTSSRALPRGLKFSNRSAAVRFNWNAKVCPRTLIATLSQHMFHDLCRPTIIIMQTWSLTMFSTFKFVFSKKPCQVADQLAFVGSEFWFPSAKYQKDSENLRFNINERAIGFNNELG